jgi:glycosyltransferase involved in cell wall biosynthesis
MRIEAGGKAPPARSREPLSLLIGSLETGGIQSSTLRLAEEFVRLGHAVSLIVVNADGPLRAQVPAGCDLVDLRARHARTALPALVRYLRAARPGIVFSAQTHINVLAIGARMLARHPRRLIVSERIALQGALARGASWMDRLRPLLIRLSYPFASAVVAVSEDARRGLLGAAGLRRPVDVIHNGVDVDRIRSQAEADDMHAWLHQPGYRLILGIGRLAPQKNFAMLLRAFAGLRGEAQRLIILGEGPERTALTRLARELGIEERVDLPGLRANPFPLLRRCDAFVLSSRWEGFANVVIEALACGAPVVATDCPGGPAEILGEGLLGKVVPVDDVPAMTAAIEHVLFSPPDRAALVRQARTFSVGRTAQQYIQLAERIR